MRFDAYHPALSFIFFATVIAAAVMFDHPVFLAIGYLSAFAYSVKLRGRRALAFDLALIPFIAVFALFFSAYNHFGVTVLAVNFIGNRITLESIAVGFVIGIKISAVAMWLSCMHAVVSSDKVIYLLGRISPRMSLFASILLRMVPRIKDRTGKMDLALYAIGRSPRQGGLSRRVRNALGLVSMIVTWMTESLAIASDSMRSRGFMLRGRTAYSIYRFDARDRSVVIILFCCIAFILAGILLDQTCMIYDPEIVMNRITPSSVLFYVAYAAFCLMPLMLQLIGEAAFAWRRRGMRPAAPYGCQKSESSDCRQTLGCDSALGRVRSIAA